MVLEEVERDTNGVEGAPIVAVVPYHDSNDTDADIRQLGRDLKIRTCSFTAPNNFGKFLWLILCPPWLWNILIETGRSVTVQVRRIK